MNWYKRIIKEAQEQFKDSNKIFRLIQNYCQIKRLGKVSDLDEATLVNLIQAYSRQIGLNDTPAHILQKMRSSPLWQEEVATGRSKRIR